MTANATLRGGNKASIKCEDPGQMEIDINGDAGTGEGRTGDQIRLSN